MASNPAMALAFSAAFAALTSPSALASIGMQPPHVPLQPPSPSQVWQHLSLHLMPSQRCAMSHYDPSWGSLQGALSSESCILSSPRR